jgi:hypothetical protein
VLPWQPLTVLRDKLSCPADSHLGTLNMSVPGAYFYIEGAFYNDTRQPGAVDYSELVLKFCDEYNLIPPRAPRETSCEACWHPRGFMQPGERPPQSGIPTRTCSRSTQFQCSSRREVPMCHVPLREWCRCLHLSQQSFALIISDQHTLQGVYHLFGICSWQL